jgi:hypothetical protein
MERITHFVFILLMFTACQSSNKGEITFENESKKVVKIIASKDSVLTKMSEGVIVRQHQNKVVFEVGSLPQKPPKIYFFVYEYTPTGMDDVEDYVKRIDYDTERMDKDDTKLVYHVLENMKCEHRENAQKALMAIQKK